MTVCSRCGAESDEAVCPDCRARTLRAVLGGVATLSVVAAVGVLVWVGTVGRLGVTARLDEPGVAFGKPILGHSAGPENRGTRTPVAATKPLSNPPLAPSPIPSTKPSAEMVSPTASVTEAGDGGVRMTAVNLSWFDDGSGKPAFAGTVAISNRTESTVTKIRLTARFSEGTFPFLILEPKQIPAGQQSILNCRMEAPPGAGQRLPDQVILQATLDGPPGAVMDEYEPGAD